MYLDNILPFPPIARLILIGASFNMSATLQQLCRGHTIMAIEIINNTREGIVMFIQAKKGNASNGGQKIQMLK